MIIYPSIAHGNLLAEKTYRGGNGPTILLNAHLDIAYELEAESENCKENGIWTSSEGILGADDRAGVAVLIHTAETLLNSSFSGKVKYIFTVKEECGLVGARNVDNYFLWGTDAAIVVDRRGTGDIVTSCGGYLPFCDPAFGELIEKIAGELMLVSGHAQAEEAVTREFGQSTGSKASIFLQVMGMSIQRWNS